jgi:hypothetical protein
MPLLKILTDPQDFKFYAGGKGYVSTYSNIFHLARKVGPYMIMIDQVGEIVDNHISKPPLMENLEPQL